MDEPWNRGSIYQHEVRAQHAIFWLKAGQSAPPPFQDVTRIKDGPGLAIKNPHKAWPALRKVRRKVQVILKDAKAIGTKTQLQDRKMAQKAAARPD